MIEIQGIKKKFGKLEVLKGFDFSLSEGKITAILGPNGSGKTTTIRMMLDLIRPIYKQTAAYGHFGREDIDLSWERTDKADALRDAAA